jgi:hypothetical protein
VLLLPIVPLDVPVVPVVVLLPLVVVSVELEPLVVPVVDPLVLVGAVEVVPVAVPVALPVAPVSLGLRLQADSISAALVATISAVRRNMEVEGMANGSCNWGRGAGEQPACPSRLERRPQARRRACAGGRGGLVTSRFVRDNSQRGRRRALRQSLQAPPQAYLRRARIASISSMIRFMRAVSAW